MSENEPAAMKPPEEISERAVDVSDRQHIPPSTAPFFQEYNFSHLDVREHEALIIERILAYGNRLEVRWLLNTYGRERVKSWVAESGVRRLPWRRYHLWCFVFGMAEPERPSRIWPH